MVESALLDAGAQAPKMSTPKDKNCPYCRQAFTSSSLGRHLDLYIKEKNPKPPDGIHDVDAIRKLRGGITRRHPRSSLVGRKSSTPTTAPRPPAKRELSAADSDAQLPPAIPRDGHYAVDSTLSKFPLVPRWEPVAGLPDAAAPKTAWEVDTALDSARGSQRIPTKQVAQKAHLDVRQKLADAMDTARAAELALRELLGSWRAAKLHMDNGAMPFDFDPLSLDFPALTLQYLRPPPTLFSSTQHPTSTSWSVQSPGQREFGALQVYFRDEFRAWRASCTSAATAASEELSYSCFGNALRDAREAAAKAEETAQSLERQVEEHLQSAYAAWEALPGPRQHELWVLELARGIGRKHKEAEKLELERHKLEQENLNLKSQVDQLNRLQQPDEFKLLPPTTAPLDRALISHAYEQGVRGGRGLGFDVADRHVDLATVVAKSIERWKNVITTTRVTATGMTIQKPLGHQAPATPAALSQSPQQQQQQQPPPPQRIPQTGHQLQPQSQQAPTLPLPAKRLSTTSTNEAPSEQMASSASNTGPPSIEEETSDQDADAEMEDDDFAIMNALPVKSAQDVTNQQQQQANTLDVPRTRGLVHQQNAAQDLRFMVQSGAANPMSRSTMAMGRTMAGINLVAMQGNHMQGGDLGMMQPVRGDAMYLD